MAPVFGQQTGLSTTDIATLTVSAMFGGAVFQIPLGRISDKTDRRYVMTAAGIIGVGAAVAGVGLLVDYAGEDVYRSGAWSLGCGVYGLGAILDFGASDVCWADHASEGGGGPRGGAGRGQAVGRPGRDADHRG